MAPRPDSLMMPRKTAQWNLTTELTSQARTRGCISAETRSSASVATQRNACASVRNEGGPGYTRNSPNYDCPGLGPSIRFPWLRRISNILSLRSRTTLHEIQCMSELNTCQPDSSCLMMAVLDEAQRTPQ
jgi:hypothetical protein